jgi:pimeloyl-ACP methyl ester carboxylesterase
MVLRMPAQARHVSANGVDFAYLEAGPADGPLVLCLHGFPDHAPTFRHLLPALAGAGFHAVAPWLRGYHPSGAAPDGRYQSATLALDAVALVEALSPDGRGDVVGHDWGALAACGTAVLAPERVRHAAMLALPHPAVMGARLVGDWEQRKRSWYMWFFQLPVLPEMMVAANDFSFVERLWTEWSPGYQPDAADMQALKATLASPGTLEAALSYYRHTIDLTRQADDLATLQADVSGGRLQVPALFLAGELDGCVEPDLDEESLAYCDGPAAVELVSGCGHFLHLEEPERVNARILALLRDEIFGGEERSLVGERARARRSG